MPFGQQVPRLTKSSGPRSRHLSEGDERRSVHTFQGKLERFGGLYGVDVPAKVSRAYRTRGFVPVAGTVNGVASFRATLIPRGEGRHRIWLNGAVRAAAQVELGHRLAIALWADTEPRGGGAPDDLTDALRGEGVLETFNSLAAGRRQHILGWIDQAVHEATRAKRIAKTVEVVLGIYEKRLDRAR